MKTTWKARLAKKLGMVVVACSMSLGMASGASGDVADPGFEDHNIDAHKGPGGPGGGGTADYTYSLTTGYGDGFSMGATPAGDSAWASRESDLSNNATWMYNTAYALSAGNPGPRGAQAMGSSSGYTYQALAEVFAPNTTYTFGIHSSRPDGIGTLAMYIYDATLITDGGDDADNLVTTGEIANTGTVAPDGTGTWQLNTLEYTTGAAGAEIGNLIGVSFWGPGGTNTYFDDASFTSVAIPEPSSLAFMGVACIGLGFRRKR